MKHCIKIINVMEYELIIRPTLSLLPFWIFLLMRICIKVNVK